MAPPTRAEIASVERDLQDQLRAQVLNEIQRRHLEAEQIAESLGMLLPSVELLLERRTWPLEVSLRVAKGLGMKVQVVAKSATE
jgi:hypothetical protein